MPSRPVHDQRHVDAALVGVLLVPLERRVAGLRPAPRVVGVAVRPADVVDAVDRLVGRLEDAVEELHLVQDAERSALLARAVVGEQQDDVLSSSTERLEVRRRSRPIWASVWSRNAANASCSRAASRCWFSGSVVPRLDARVARRELGAGRDEAEPLAGGRTTRRGPRPSRRRTGRGTSRGTPAAPGAARGSRRRRGRGRTAGRAAPTRCRAMNADAWSTRSSLRW